MFQNRAVYTFYVMICNIPENWCVILVSHKVRGKTKLKEPNKFLMQTQHEISL
jgi:hypothetical protein